MAVVPIMTEMSGFFSRRYRTFLRALGIGVWLFILYSVRLHRMDRNFPAHEIGLGWWLAIWLMYGVCFWMSTSPSLASYRVRGSLIMVESLAGLTLDFFQPRSSVGFLLIIVAWQVALLFPPRIAVSWIAAQCVLYSLQNGLTLASTDWPPLALYFCFKAFSATVVIFAKQESEMRAAQVQLNAELLATRGLLEESTRSLERLRIARDLHDALGHSLTAMSLHLEVALNNQNPIEREAHIRKAYAVNANMLQDVRGVVRALRHSDGMDLNGVLEDLTQSLPGLLIHLSTPRPLMVRQQDQAQAIVRCVQELITNAVRHANASQLWISISNDSGSIRITARDDGRSKSPDPQLGSGLLGMRERFESLGGSVDFDFGDTKGFLVAATLPSSLHEEFA